MTWLKSQGTVGAIALFVAAGANLVHERPAFAELVPQWVVTHSKGTAFSPQALAVDSAGNSYIASTRGETTAADIIVTSFDSEGGLRWQAEFIGPSGQDIAIDVSVAADESAVYALGRSAVPGFANSDYVIIRYDAAGGAELWHAFYDGPASGIDDPHAIAATPDGGVVATGGVWNDDERYDYGTVKFNAAGVMQWDELFGDNGAFLLNDDEAEVIAITPEEGPQIRSVGFGDPHSSTPPISCLQAISTSCASR